MVICRHLKEFTILSLRKHLSSCLRDNGPLSNSVGNTWDFGYKRKYTCVLFCLGYIWDLFFWSNEGYGLRINACKFIWPFTHMAKYDEIAYSMNIVSLFLVTYGASCEFVDDFCAIKWIPMVNIYMEHWDQDGGKNKYLLHLFLSMELVRIVIFTQFNSLQVCLADFVL